MIMRFMLLLIVCSMIVGEIEMIWCDLVISVVRSVWLDFVGKNLIVRLFFLNRFLFFVMNVVLIFVIGGVLMVSLVCVKDGIVVVMMMLVIKMVCFNMIFFLSLVF